MKKRKQTVTLIEILIALGITVAILSAMMWCYRTVVEMGHKTDLERQTVFRLSYVQARLAYVLPLAQKSPFYRSEQGLVFQFNNGSNLDKELGNDVIGRLYLDKNKQLCLAVMPAQNRWKETPPIKQEVLLENVEELTFRYFTKDAGWQEEVNRLPAIIEVSFIVDGATKSYRFPLPNAKETIVL